MSRNSLETLGGRITERREAMGLSQAGLARASGVSRPMIIHLERGGGSPRSKNLKRLVQALETSADYLLGLTDDPTPRMWVKG